MALSIAAGLIFRLGLQLGGADEAAIRGLYKTFDEAFEKQDLEALEALFAADYVATLADGSQDGRDAALAEIREESAMALPPIHCRAQIKKVSVAGAAAVVSVAEETSYQVRANDGKAHGYRYSESYEDRLVKVEGHWRFHETRYARGEEEQLDGRAIPAGQLKKLLAAMGSDDWQIRDLYGRADQAFEKRDFAAFVASYAADWVFTLGDEVAERERAFASVRHEIQVALAPVHRHSEVKQLSVRDNLATAQIARDSSYGVQGPGGKPHVVRYTQLLEEQLTRREERWLVQATRLLEGGSATLDGRAMTKDESRGLLGR